MRLIATRDFRANIPGSPTGTSPPTTLLHQDEHVGPVPGGRTPTHIAENLAVAAVTLTSGQVADLTAALDGVSPSGTVRPL